MGGHEYTHYRLCESYREGRFIRNRTLLSLGDLESVLPPEKIPFLCKRINQVYLEGKHSSSLHFAMTRWKPCARNTWDYSMKRRK